MYRWQFAMVLFASICWESTYVCVPIIGREIRNRPLVYHATFNCFGVRCVFRFDFTQCKEHVSQSLISFVTYNPQNCLHFNEVVIDCSVHIATEAVEAKDPCIDSTPENQEGNKDKVKLREFLSCHFIVVIYLWLYCLFSSCNCRVEILVKKKTLKKRTHKNYFLIDPWQQNVKASSLSHKADYTVSC